MNRIVLLVALVAALFAFSTPAFADPPGGCEGGPPCGQGGGQGPGGNGGAGGQGGPGGAGGQGGVGDGGDAFAAQGQLQGQLQGQAQGQAQGVFDSGNSASSSSASATGGNATQGQIGIQGQLGILDNENTLDNSTSVGTSTSTSTSSSNGQDQTSVGSVDSHDSLTVEGDDIVYEAPDIPVNSAAPVFAGACSQGVSVQTQSFGGSAGTTNPVCDYVAVAGGFIAAGDRDDALRVLVKAEDAADWRYRFSQIRSVLTLGLL
jgi:hypothetical protein